MQLRDCLFEQIDSCDIVVCIPKDRLEIVKQEEADVCRREAAGETGIEYYWQMSRLSKRQPRRIYFVWDGACRAWHDVTFTDASQNRIYMSTRINEIQPIPMKSFRGFRYFKGV